MAGSVNKVILIGNVGRDPEVRRLENGIVIASFSLATSESYIDKTTNERKENTDWHNVVMYRGLAEIAEKYIHKGDKVYIEGKLRTRSWNDLNGNPRYTTEIITEEMTMLSPKRDSNNATNPYPSTGQQKPQAPMSGISQEIPPGLDDVNPSDDLPF